MATKQRDGWDETSSHADADARLAAAEAPLVEELERIERAMAEATARKRAIREQRLELERRRDRALERLREPGAANQVIGL